MAFWGRVFICSDRNWDQKEENYKIQGRIDKISSVRARNCKEMDENCDFGPISHFLWNSNIPFALFVDRCSVESLPVPTQDWNKLRVRRTM